MGTGMLWYQVCVMAKQVACPFDLNHDGMMQQSIQQCGCDHGIAEDVTPFCEAAV
jgi:hypothetical protein